MWENVIGIVNEERGTNAGVEALINAPTVGQGRKAAAARRAAAAEAVMATGAFDTAVTDYQSLLTLAKSQGAVGGTNRGACKVCGQLGHLTKQCRNQFSKFYQNQADGGAAVAAGGGGVPPATGADSDSTLNSLDRSNSDSSDSDSGSSSSEEERRRRKRKEKKRRREKREMKRRRKESKSGKDKKEKEHRHKSKRSKHSRSRSAAPTVIDRFV